MNNIFYDLLISQATCMWQDAIKENTLGGWATLYTYIESMNEGTRCNYKQQVELDFLQSIAFLIYADIER